MENNPSMYEITLLMFEALHGDKRGGFWEGYRPCDYFKTSKDGE